VRVQFDVSDDEFQVKEGDHFGWTGRDNNRFISRDDEDSQCQDCTRSRWFNIDGEERFCVPTVREKPYTNIIPPKRQFIFSAAVRINRHTPRKRCSVSLLYSTRYKMIIIMLSL